MFVNAISVGDCGVLRTWCAARGARCAVCVGVRSGEYSLIKGDSEGSSCVTW